MFQHTAARRRLHEQKDAQCFIDEVSTHSRAEAAAYTAALNIAIYLFQHTAARRRLPEMLGFAAAVAEVSTHSRAEAAAIIRMRLLNQNLVSTHSRAEAAAFYW